LIVLEGMKSYGYIEDACCIARNFMATIDHGFANDATIREKYNLDKQGAAVHVTAGHKENAVGFGWTNGAYLIMQRLLAEVGV
jgi:alpha,alpha-trehalase